MRKFLRKRWHRLPIGIVIAVLAVCLLVGGVLAVYPFLTATISVVVDEPMTVEYNWPGGDVGWLPLADEATLSISGVAGDSETFELKVCNAANNPINVTTTLGGNTGKFTVTGLPNGSIPANGCWTGSVTATINADAPVGTYTLTVTFARG